VRFVACRPFLVETNPIRGTAELGGSWFGRWPDACVLWLLAVHIGLGKVVPHPAVLIAAVQTLRTTQVHLPFPAAVGVVRRDLGEQHSFQFLPLQEIEWVKMRHLRVLGAYMSGL
jgi:hypothetical protein